MSIIKKLTLQNLFRVSNNQGFHIFPDPVVHFGLSRRWGVTGGAALQAVSKCPLAFFWSKYQQGGKLNKIFFREISYSESVYLNVNFPPHFSYFPKTTAAAVCGLRKCFSSHTRYISRDNELDKHWTKLVIILPSSVTTTTQLLSLLQFTTHKNNFSSPGLSIYFSTRGENGQLGGEGIKSPLSQWDLIQDVQSELSKTKRSSLSTQDWWVNFTDTWPFGY